jgi:VWFA-related protein
MFIRLLGKRFRVPCGLWAAWNRPACQNVTFKMMVRIIVVLLWLAPQVFGQASDPAFRTETSLVVMDVQAYQRGSGQYITHLKKEDITILDNNRAQEIRIFEFSEAPVDIVLLLDMSGSMVQIIREASLGVRAALEGLGRDDRVAVMSFAGRGSRKTHLELSSNREQVEAGVEKAMSKVTRFEPGTRLFDAVAESLKLFEPQYDKRRRRAVVVVTDDQEQGSEISGERLTTAVLEKNVTLHGIIFVGHPMVQRRRGGRITIPIPGIPDVDIDTQPPVKGPNYGSIRPIIDESGGEYRYASASREALVEMLSRIRARYLVGYMLPEAQRTHGTHNVEVWFSDQGRISFPDGLIRARKHYTY